jgi:hypothetical protein
MKMLLAAVPQGRSLAQTLVAEVLRFATGVVGKTPAAAERGMNNWAWV